MKKKCIWIAFVCFLYILQSAVFPFLAVRGISTDFLLLFTVSFAFLYGSDMGAYAGFLTGVLQDLATGTFFGVDIFAKTLIGFVCGLFSNRVYKEQWLLPVVAVGIASIANNIIVTGFIFLLGYKLDILRQWELTWPLVLFFNAFFALPVHYAVYSLYKMFTENKQNG